MQKLAKGRGTTTSNMAIMEQLGEASSSDEETAPILVTKTNNLTTDPNA